jgi:hypothetical protein
MRWKIGVIVWVLGLAGSCSATEPRPFLSRLGEGDRYLGWSLNYFDSWRMNRQVRYLRLAEENTVSAITTFARLETDTSPRINEYYVVRERRIRGCRLLAELRFEADSHGVAISESTPEGCFY